MKQFDLISDIHLDFWIRGMGISGIDPFVKSLLPQEISNVLVIAGDLGHSNDQNYHLLKALKNYYAHILVIAGNHDYYLVNSKERYKHHTSIKRWTQMKELMSSLENVIALEGNRCEIDGVRFGGTGMWYDFSYGIQVLGRSLSFMLEHWASRMNDINYMTGLPRRTLDMFWEEKKKLDQIIHDSDVIITHVSPDWSHIDERYRIDPVSGFYYFDGSQYMEQIEGKIWCTGHVHLSHSYMHQGCWFINNALGYPDENNRPQGKIVNIPLERGDDGKAAGTK